MVLLPGVLFFLGVYWPEHFTREAESRTPLGQLAGVLLVSLTIHGLLYAFLGSFCRGWLPCISVEQLLYVVHGESARAVHTSQMLHQFRWWIFSYVMVTSLMGAGVGAGYGWLVSTRKMRGFARHRWIYDLSVDGLTYAYVLTNVREGKHVLMYKGFLRAFGLQQDGRFSYIVLTDVTRLYLSLEEEGSITSGMHVQKVIGSSTPGDKVSVPTDPTPKKRAKSLFVIEGEDISNAVFDIFETPAAPLKPAELRKLIEELTAEILEAAVKSQTA